VPCSVPSPELALNITLGYAIQPPSPPVPDPLVLATLKVNNRTVKIRIGHVRVGAASTVHPSIMLLAMCLAVVMVGLVAPLL